ncbi:hypothetical protein Cs7R123_05580 [Catellatospora sp. TT07R-123]|uniref:SGNH/GDSL hydrolase family protein n=1 Tax=Catellatospora sp. TT07R-123 TaxID=2733863 RepID=UPI001B2DA490|nr:SGNH/GDSL hydrolase family protein [Catellatospora sp. TT07R-123]GHJ43216.1 hypothetical protein Cs7R123_05580 [Catellatospora sp. TT07R-123]
MTTTEATDPYLADQEDLEKQLTGAKWRRFAVLGDSIAEGMGEATPGYADRTWFDRVHATLSRTHEVDLRNVAQRDLRAADIRAKQLPAAVEFGPDLAVLIAGGNDLFSRGFDPDLVEADLDAIVGTLRAGGATVIAVTLMDIVSAVPQLAGGAMDRLPILNERTRAVCARHGALVLDAFVHPMCAERNVYSADFKHPTMRGHAILAIETLRLLAAAQ